MVSPRFRKIPNVASYARDKREIKETEEINVKKMILFDMEKDLNKDYEDQIYLVKKPANLKTNKVSFQKINCGLITLEKMKELRKKTR